MRKTVLITGTSSGIGRASVENFSEHGWNVTATMRDPSSAAGESLSKLPNVIVQRLDVTDPQTVESAIAATLSNFGNLHAVINNAGYGLAGPMEFVTEEQLLRQYKTNVFGPVYVMQAAIPHFRKNGQGVIVNVASVGGRLVLPFNSLYHGSKFALEAISEGAALELAPQGIRLKIVEPGGVKTDFAGRSLVMTSKESEKAYDQMMDNALKVFAQQQQSDTGSMPEDIAKVIYQAATDTSPKLRFAAGEDAKTMINERDQVSDEEYQMMMTDRYNLLAQADA